MKINAFEETESKINLTELVGIKERFSGKSGRKYYRRVDKTEEKEKIECKGGFSSSPEQSETEESRNANRKAELTLTKMKDLARKLLKDKEKKIVIKETKFAKVYPDFPDYYDLDDIQLADEDFQGIYETLAPGSMVNVDLVDAVIESLISSKCYQDVIGYMSSFSFYNIMRGLYQLVYRQIYMNSLLRKQLIIFNTF